MKIYWIDEFVKGRLGSMPRPKGDAELANEMDLLAAEGTNLVVSFLEPAEAKLLGLEQEGRLCFERNMDFVSFPIQDYGVPSSSTSYLKLCSFLLDKIKEGKRVVVHCHGGIGRSSVVAAGVLIKNGCEIDEVFELVTGYREHQVPDTKEQIAWVVELFKKTN